MSSTDLERQIQHLLDIEAIKRLRSLYCYYADAHDSENWSNLFTEDGVFETDVSAYTKDAMRFVRYSTSPLRFTM